MVIGETRGQAPDLLQDGGQIQRMMAELHGTQRYRLGWSESDLERETSLMLAEITQALRNAADTAESSRALQSAGASGADIRADAVQLATEYAVAVVRHVLEQGTRTALRAYRFARSADAP
jgi:hypothetical protein